MPEVLNIDLESEEYKADPLAYINKLHSAQVDGLKSKNSELLQKVAGAKPVDNTELDSLRQFKSQADIQSEAAKGNFEEALKLASTNHASELEKALTAGKTANHTIETLLIDNGLASALDGAKVMAEAKEAATALFRSSAVIEDGKALINGKPLGEHIAEWAKSDQGKFFTQAPNNQGGGAGGGSGGNPSGFNPWAKDSYNLTKQGEILRSDPELAARLRGSA